MKPKPPEPFLPLIEPVVMIPPTVYVGSDHALIRKQQQRRATMEADGFVPVFKREGNEHASADTKGR